MAIKKTTAEHKKKFTPVDALRTIDTMRSIMNNHFNTTLHLGRCFGVAALPSSIKNTFPIFSEPDHQSEKHRHRKSHLQRNDSKRDVPQLRGREQRISIYPHTFMHQKDLDRQNNLVNGPQIQPEPAKLGSPGKGEIDK